MLRCSLAGLCVVVSFGAAHAAPPLWELRQNLTSEAFEKEHKDLTEKGYVPTQIGAAVVGKDKELRFLAVWEKRDENPTRECRHDLTAKQIEKAIAERKEKGFRVVEVSGYEVGGEARFAVIWEKEAKDAPVYEVHTVLTSDEYRTLYPKLSNQGFRPLRLTGYQVGKETRYATIWEKAAKDAPAWHVRRDLTKDQYQDEFDGQSAQGMRVVQVSVYTVDGEMRFAGVWEKGIIANGWHVRHRLDAKTFESQNNIFKSQGFRLQQVSVQAIDGQPQYTGVWVNDTPRPVPKGGLRPKK